MYLLRHGEVAYFADPAAPMGHEEVVLTAAGVRQAQASGRALAPVRFDRVITSGLPRTRRTAEIILEQLEHPPEREPDSWPDLCEFQPGVLDDVPDENLEDQFMQVFRGQPPLEATFMGGESVGSLVERVGLAMERLYADRDWETALVVLHGGVNRAILSWAIAGQGAFFAHFEQSPACINIVDGGPEFFVRGVNITPYDPVPAGSRLTTLEEMLIQYRDYRARS